VSVGFFPKRLFFRFVGAQAFVLLVAAVIGGVSFKSLAVLLLSFAVFSALIARRFFAPLGRLIQKAKNSSLETLQETQGDRETSGRQEYEWEELESALDRMRSDLRSKTDALAKEQQELEVLMAAIPEAIVAVDTESRLLYFNSRFALLFGDQKSEARPVLGEVFRAPEVLETFRRALREEQTATVEVRLHTRTDQSTRNFTVSVTPLRRDSGPVYSAVGIFHDVTELKQAEKIRIDFVANVSHELRTPLTAIKGYTDTLSTDVRDRRFDSLDHYITVIQRNTERLMMLIEDLLDLSSLESNEGPEVAKNSVSTREISSRIIAQMEPRRAMKDQTFDTQYGSEYVQSDSRRLEQVLVNLIDNAIKYGPQGGVVQVIWEKSQKSVFLRVKDNGPGIPREYLPRLFERFFRVDKARSREMGGTGLGLAIVKHIMQRHGGSVQVKSDLGQGTEFICEFPDAG
jgi:two-component system phosphate regulon sensor histidine kinase PhoR